MNPQILEARNSANLDRVNAHDLRLDRIGVIAEMLFTEVVRDSPQDYPAKVVSAVAFLSEELADSHDEQAAISDRLRTFERDFQGGEYASPEK